MKNAFFYESPIGKIVIKDNGAEITDIDLVGDEICFDNFSETSLIKEAAKQLDEYFSGKRTSFDLPLNPKGTEFQKSVWKALCDIPYGETRTYKEVAEAVGNPKAARAVGMANNKNPIMIIIPCHRVVGSNGSLVGYAGGIDIKRTLLSIESSFTLY